MTTYVGLVRAINVGGHNRVAMSALRDLMTRLDFADGRTLLQSGNIVFRSAARSTAALERRLEAGTAGQLDLRAEWFVRSATEWQAIMVANPFPEQARRDPARLIVMLLKKAPTASDVAALRKAITGPETVHATGTHAYLTYPTGIGTSRLTTALLESRLGTRGTARNWNTVRRLAALTADADR